ncbi:DUF1667 domain-containing protein [Anaerocolumna sedimenticola]|uniref:DUF1667 domain-containing protein n=1 Tax=Anaerocolumna sedimenticola TaxID=2696063 RepID=A0A6P1TQ09_9FIRM|nr:DUF1667 domain-containing protein [Anaerocolumna sedimenticola]QHQ62272.1 DUF1667 domain-containing protein [Anaerocolumna sedimenticola]
MENKDLICIGCPLGCMIHVEMQNGLIINVKGNSCKIGDEYARKEITNPTRIVTSSVRIINGAVPMVSVKTSKDIPKDKINECMEAIKSCTINAPVHIGDKVIKNVAGTGADIIITKNIDRAA